MRKTLTVISLVLAAGSLAACKMFWEKDPKPEAAATLTAEPATSEPSTMAEGTKPEQTASASNDKPAAPEGGKAGQPPVPATK